MAEKKDTKKIIIDVAAQLFWEKSYSGVSMDLICKTAKVQKGSLYYFFPSKDDLALAVLDYFWQGYEANILKPSFEDMSVPPLARIEKYFNAMRKKIMTQFEVTGRFYGCPVVNITSEQGTQNERIREKGDAFFQKFSVYFLGTLEEAEANKTLRADLAPEKAAKLFCSCWQGNIVLAKAKNDPSNMWEPIEILQMLIKAT